MVLFTDKKRGCLDMCEAAFKNIDKTLREDDGCGIELDYIGQTRWASSISRATKTSTNEAVCPKTKSRTWGTPAGGGGNTSHIYKRASLVVTEYLCNINAGAKKTF